MFNVNEPQRGTRQTWSYYRIDWNEVRDDSRLMWLLSGLFVRPFVVVVVRVVLNENACLFLYCTAERRLSDAQSLSQRRDDAAQIGNVLSGPFFELCACFFLSALLDVDRWRTLNSLCRKTASVARMAICTRSKFGSIGASILVVRVLQERINSNSTQTLTYNQHVY
jgi:hypothetical protein